MVELEQLLHDNPHKKLLVRALELKHATNFDSVVDLFLNEMLLTGLHPSLPTSQPSHHYPHQHGKNLLPQPVPYLPTGMKFHISGAQWATNQAH